MTELTLLENREKEEFIKTAESRQTSPELMEAIFITAGYELKAAVSLWENGPTDAELVNIVEIVTNNGLNANACDFEWGEEGTNWAKETVNEL